MAKREYTLSKFYLYLKLGIWQKGPVEGLGLVQKIEPYDNGFTNKGCILIKQPEIYKNCEIIKKEFLRGLYLVDLSLLDTQLTSRYNNKYQIYNYLVVISECRLKGAFEEHIYYLKVTNNRSLEQFEKIIYNIAGVIRKCKWSPIKSKHRVSRFDNSPLNSVKRKY